MPAIMMMPASGDPASVTGSSSDIADTGPKGDARGVVDADMDELPAGAFTSGPCVALPPAVAGDAVADLVEAAELLDVDVGELARVLAFVASHRLGRLEVPEAAQAGALE